ncbi:enoyl-CoA hydratase/isomerase family protein, partial [Candidatus Zixiibacteriota bacterium]
FISEGKKLMGLNEIKLGVPVPYPADRILRNLTGWRTARDVMDGGEFYSGQELLQKGLVDQVLPMEEVLPGAIEKAGALSASSPEAFALIKRNRTEPVKAEILAELDERERRFVERWYSPEARERLDEAIDKF